MTISNKSSNWKCGGKKRKKCTLVSVEKEMEETTRAIIYKDKRTPRVLISKVTVYDGPQIKWAKGHMKGPPCSLKSKHGTNTGAQSPLSALPLVAQCQQRQAREDNIIFLTCTSKNHQEWR